MYCNTQLPLTRLKRDGTTPEEHDSAHFKAWAVPPLDGNCIKVVCVTGRRRKDPSATGSGGDRDTLSCKSDLTGLFWTRPYERMGLAKELGDAEKAV